ncbi:MAG TPA: adenylate/guanylate cyclase domain-containing protein [Anaerolineae bacterium]|nr:adenylate/guanylate cyclase domain-containing protein [Anaerolineae bacterium]
MHTGAILVVEDNEFISEPLEALLELDGHRVTVVGNGRLAIDILQKQEFDLILLDIMMPEVDGYQVLAWLKQNDHLRHIPVIMMTAVNEINSVIKCIEMGATDYLFKPFNAVLLNARIQSSLEKKSWRDQERAYIKQLRQEQIKSDDLLANILPHAIINQLKQDQHHVVSRFDSATVMFANIVGFMQISRQFPPQDFVQLLNEVFSLFDELTEQYQVEKIKTIGSQYMVVSGAPDPHPHHAATIADMALAMRQQLKQLSRTNSMSLTLRIGISTGPLTAGVIGTQKLTYDLWGDTVNTASRMESTGLPDTIQTTASTYNHLHKQYSFVNRGQIPVKGKGYMQTYLLQGKL